jgi:hypothetical protein
MISSLSNETSRTSVQETHYATAVSKEEIIVDDDTPANISKVSSSESGVSPSFTTPFQQSSTSLTDPAITDRKFTTENQNQPIPSIEKKLNAKPDGEAVNKTEKINIDGTKTVKRENSKGWF